MAKLWNYVVLTVGIMILFYLTGLTTSEGIVLGGSNYNMTAPGELTNLQDIDFFTNFSVLGWIALFGAGTALITIGLYYSRTTAYQILSAGIAGAILIKFIADMVTVVMKLNASSPWMGYLGLLLMGPFTFGYILAIWDWVGGKE